MGRIKVVLGLAAGLVVAPVLSMLVAAPAHAQVASGYSEYFIPGNENEMSLALRSLGPTPTNNTHARITITAWSENTTLYYDHWENGLGFDPTNPEATADQVFNLGAVGSVLILDNTPGGGIPIPRNPANQYYDGGDRLYVAGGAVTVARVSYLESRGLAIQAVAWEIYPVKPQLTTYVVPFGQNLAGTFPDFLRTYALIQATADNTTFSVDLDGDGDFDRLDQNFDGDTADAEDTDVVTLQAGETFFLGFVPVNPNPRPRGARATLNSGAIIQGSSTLQVKFVIGDQNANYETRGLSAFPRGYWTRDYYAPVGEPANATWTDLFLFNPHASPITVAWQTLTGSGSFSIGAGATISFRDVAGTGALPVGGGLYLQGSDVFWGVSTIDSTGQVNEWAYSLLPSTLLYQEHYLGWAPGGADGNDSGIFLTVVQDNTRVFVDTNNDGIPEQTYTLDRLESQYITDADGDLSGTRFWATGLFTMAFGQNPDTAPPQASSGDLGYVAIPATDFISLVLTVDKSANPAVVPTTAGSETTFTLRVRSQKYTVEGVEVVDTLPPGWQYVADSTTITQPDLTTLSGAAANPTVAGSTLTWSSSQVGGASCTPLTTCMAENQQIVISFRARTTGVLAAGTLSENRVRASGSRTVGSPSTTQRFVARDFAYVTSGDVAITKTSSVDYDTPLYPGDPLTYTVTVTNPSATPLDQVSLYDALPTGVSMVPGSTTFAPPLGSWTVRDNFSSANYGNNNGTRNWATSWTESGDDGSPSSGRILITGNELSMRGNRADRSIQRSVLIDPCARSATLSYNYSTTSNLEGTDDIVVEYRLGGSATWTQLAQYTGNQAASVASLDLPFASAPTLLEIRFRFPAADDYADWWAAEYFRVDNVLITVDQGGGDPPSMLAADCQITLAGGASLTATFDVTVDDPLPSGLSSITNTAATTSTQYPIQLTASVTNLVVSPSSLSASVAGRVWFDADGDGVQDVGESGIPNVEVTLKDRFGTPLAVLVTDTNGRYLFPGVAPGIGYYVEATDGLPAGVSQTFPIGSTNNRTTTFDLAAGQAYTNADLGYQSATSFAAIGDLVWVDPNANGLRDAGEIGLGGVSIRVYRDQNGDGRLDDGDLLVATALSSPDGSYLFTGLPPITLSDPRAYLVVVEAPFDPDNPDYSPTTPVGYVIWTLPGGASYVTADFGFEATAFATYTLSDRVWLDSDGDGAYDPGDGEGGIGGVTVALLDGSLNVIGTTTTAADGSFTFSGLPGSEADYTVRLTDTSGVLTDYVGTTPYGQARERSEPNLVHEVNRTDSGAAYYEPPSYGFRATRAIGDTVFVDVDGDGTQGPGEPPIVGALVRLYRDTDGDGIIDVGEPQVGGSITTNAAGQYLFSGLTSGSYIVSVETPASYTYPAAASPDTDPSLPGAGQPVTIERFVVMAGVSYYDADFGFQPNVARTLSGTVWNDVDANGLIDGTDAGIAGVTLEVRDAGGNVVRTVTTDASGFYSVDGLAGAEYTVVVTDTLALLTGYEPTYEVSEGTAAPFDGEETVDLASANASDLNFGYRRPSVTYAAIAGISAYRMDGSVIVEWRTSLEAGTLGFHLFRLDPVAAAYVPVTERLVPALPGRSRGGVYRVRDEGAAATVDGLTYVIVEKDIRGRSHSYGPYALWVNTEAPLLAQDERVKRSLDARSFSRSPMAPSRARQALRGVAARERSAAMDLALRRPSSGTLRVTTREEGLTYLGPTHMKPTVPHRAPTDRGFRAPVPTLTNRGQFVATLPDKDGGVYFYAEPVASPFTLDNVYWQTSSEAGRTMPRRPSAEGGLAVTSFTETIHVEQDLLPVLSLLSDPRGDMLAWEIYYASYDGYDGATHTFPLTGVTSQGDAALTVHLVGYNNTVAPLDHQVRVSLNGHFVGTAQGDGIGPFSVELPLDPSIIEDGENTIELQAVLGAGVSESFVYLDSFDLTYERTLRAGNDLLRFTVPHGSDVMVEGFSGEDILLVDITTPTRPVIVTPASVDPAGDGSYTLRFGATGEAPVLRFEAVLRSRVKVPAAVTAWTSAGLRLETNAADYVLIAPDALATPAQALADYRSGQGLDTRVVSLQAIDDEFNFGLAEPEAIRSFLRFARESWATAPRYVTLVGRGTYDYKDAGSTGDNLVPTLFVASPEGLLASDVPFADLEGDDGIPDLALGRLPVVTAQELQDYITKIQSHEAAPDAPWQGRVLLTADNPDGAGNFTADSESLASLIPPDYDLTRVYLGDVPAPVVPQDILVAINGGVRLFNYIGHGGLQALADGLFTSADVSSLENAERLTLFLGMTCGVGDFSGPGQPSLAETLLLRPGGGTYASWASTWLSENEYAVRLNQAFVTAAFAGTERVLGDLILEALRNVDATGSEHMRFMYNLLGEPVAKLPPRPPS